MKIIKTKARKKAGFTLAEILIILVIIGVVAAIVIGSLIINAQKTNYVTSLQKINSSLASATNRSQADNASMHLWNYKLSSKDFTDQYFTKYLNIINICDDREGCFAESYFANDGSTGKDVSEFHKFVLSDGIAVGIKTAGEGGCSNTNPSICATIVVDVNSTQGPNQWGKDLFAFNIYGNLNAIVPSGTFASYNEDIGKWIAAESSEIDTNCLSSGEYCAAKIANEGWEMNY